MYKISYQERDDGKFWNIFQYGSVHTVATAKSQQEAERMIRDLLKERQERRTPTH